jgi:uncharacterized protein (TIGR00661 family)
MTHHKKVIVAPLNWGLGHASRCVPIIKSLIKNQFTPVIASDGNALEFLKKEFPTLESFELPSYNISYGKNLKWTLFLKSRYIATSVHKEHAILQEYLKNHQEVVGVISDNRFGMYSKKISSVYITHQINVLSGFFTWLTSYLHQRIIKKFDECWIPDDIGSIYSGKLSKSKRKLNQKYIGVLSRFKKQNFEQEIDVLIVLSGPEPNRTQLESKLLSIYKTSNEKICLVQGKIENTQRVTSIGNVKVVNFMLSKELQKALNSSKMIVCRSGYSSIMDLISLGKKAVLIPTKHQNEQEYLAKYLQGKGSFQCMEENQLDERILDITMIKPSEEYQAKEFDSSLFGFFQSK